MHPFFQFRDLSGSMWVSSEGWVIWRVLESSNAVRAASEPVPGRPTAPRGWDGAAGGQAPVVEKGAMNGGTQSLGMGQKGKDRPISSILLQARDGTVKVWSRNFRTNLQ